MFTSAAKSALNALGAPEDLDVEEEAYALNFVGTLIANLDNEKLTDFDFREFCRDSLNGVKGYEKPERVRPPESKL